MRTGDLDRLIVPERPMDILAQQIVAACAADEWQADDLFDLVRRAYPYRELPREAFDETVDMLAEGIAARRGRFGTYLHYDRVNGRLKGRRGARLAAITGGGAIPDTALYTVVSEPEGIVVGTVDEDFAVESMARRRYAAGQRVVADPARAGGEGARRGCARRGAEHPVLALARRRRARWSCRSRSRRSARRSRT